MVNDELPTKQSPKNHNHDLIVPLFHKYRYYDGSIPLRILGRVILFCHELQERVLIKKYKKNHNCKHPSNFCVCANKAIQHIIRPYRKFCIFQPYRLSYGRFAITNELVLDTEMSPHQSFRAHCMLSKF